MAQRSIHPDSLRATRSSIRGGATHLKLLFGFVLKFEALRTSVGAGSKSGRVQAIRAAVSWQVMRDDRKLRSQRSAARSPDAALHLSNPAGDRILQPSGVASGVAAGPLQVASSREAATLEFKADSWELLQRHTTPKNTPKTLDLWTPPLRQVAKKCRLRDQRRQRTAWDVWEVNAGWVVWLDGAAVLMTRVTGILLDTGTRRPGACNEVTLCVMKTAIATSSPHSGD